MPLTAVSVIKSVADLPIVIAAIENVTKTTMISPSTETRISTAVRATENLIPTLCPVVKEVAGHVSHPPPTLWKEEDAGLSMITIIAVILISVLAVGALGRLFGHWQPLVVLWQRLGFVFQTVGRLLEHSWVLLARILVTI